MQKAIAVKNAPVFLSVETCIGLAVLIKQVVKNRTVLRRNCFDKKTIKPTQKLRFLYRKQFLKIFKKIAEEKNQIQKKLNLIEVFNKYSKRVHRVLRKNQVASKTKDLLLVMMQGFCLIICNIMLEARREVIFTENSSIFNVFL